MQLIDFTFFTKYIAKWKKIQIKINTNIDLEIKRRSYQTYRETAVNCEELLKAFY